MAGRGELDRELHVIPEEDASKEIEPRGFPRSGVVLRLPPSGAHKSITEAEMKAYGAAPVTESDAAMSKQNRGARRQSAEAPRIPKHPP